MLLPHNLAFQSAAQFHSQEFGPSRRLGFMQACDTSTPLSCTKTSAGSPASAAATRVFAVRLERRPAACSLVILHWRVRAAGKSPVSWGPRATLVVAKMAWRSRCHFTSKSRKL